MFSFIDDIPSAEQIKARVRDDIKKYKIDEYVRNARLVQTANRLYNDEELKINPVAWIWKRWPSLGDMAQWRIVGFSKRHKVAIAGFCAGPILGAYSASKHGLVGLAGSLRAEVEPHGVRVCLVEPGVIATPI